MKWFRRSLPSLLVFLATFLVVAPVFAYDYYVVVTVSSNTSQDYSDLPVMVTINNSALAEFGYIDSDGMDTAVYEGASERESVVAASRLGLLVPEILGNQELTFHYRLNTSSERDAMPLIVGDGGCVEVSDDADLELGDTFSINTSVYINSTSATIVEKKDGFLLGCEDGFLEADIIRKPNRTIDVTPTVYGSWQDVDVSDYVPDSATGVAVLGVAPSVTYTWEVRAKGSTNDITSIISRTGLAIDYVGLDENDTFEAWVESSSVSLYLLAYMDDSWTFFTDWIDLNPVGTGAWEVQTLTPVVPEGTQAAILLLHNTGSSLYSVGVMGGVSYPVFLAGDMIVDGWASCIVPLNADRKFGLYRESSVIDCYLTGYISDGFVWVNPPVDKGFAGGSYVNINTASEAPEAVGLLFDVFGAGNNDVDFRHQDDTVSYAEEGSMHWWWPVPRPAEGYTEASGVGCNLTGYFEDGVVFYDPLVGVSTIVESGEHSINVTADGSSLYLWLDGALEDTESLEGASVPDNGEDWELFSNGVPYADSYKHYVDGSLVAWYEPNTMISGTVLTDRQGGDENGAITWGSNPSGISVTVGALESVASYVPPGSDAEDAPDALPDPAIDWHEDTSVDLSDKVGYDMVSRAAESMGMSTQRFYGMLVIIVGVALGFASMVAIGSVWGFTILFGLTVGAASSSDYIAFWPAVVAIMFAFFISMIWSTR